MTHRRALPVLALTLLSPALPAQNWFRTDYGAVAELRFVARDDGVLIDLTRDDAFDFARVRRHAHDGEILDGFKIDTLFGGVAMPMDMALLPSGDIVIVGAHESDNGDPSVPWIGVFDPDAATMQWVQRFTSPNMLFARVVVTADRIYAVGHTENDQTLVTAKLDFAGNLDWAREWGLSGQVDDLRDVCATASGDLVAIVHDSNDHSHVFYLTANAQLAWHRYYDSFFARAVCEIDGGELWVAGQLSGGVEAIIALSSTSATLRRMRYLGYPAQVMDICPRPDGGALLTSTRDIQGAFQPSITALDANGVVEWSRAYELSEIVPWGGAAETVHVAERGWIIRGQVNGDARYAAVNEDGTADLPCVTITNLATVTLDASFGPDEPPASSIEPWNPNPQPWILQPNPWAYPLELRCGTPCRVSSATFGVGTHGTALITPELSAVGGACAGRPYPLIELDKGLGGTIGAFGFSIGSTSLPVLGGTLYLDPQSLVTVPILLDGSPSLPGDGTWSLEITGGLVDYMGTMFATQVFLADPGAPQGLSMSNAVLLAAGL